MAQGDVTLFDEFLENIGGGDHDLAADTLLLGIIDNTTTPTAGDATPAWADYSANEVSTAGGYVANGIALTSKTWSEAAGTATLDAANISLAQNASGFTDGYWGILYNGTSVGDLAIGFVELGGPVSEQAGPVAINWNAGGIFTLS